MIEEEEYCCQYEPEAEIRDSVTLESVGGGSWLSFILGGLFANWVSPRKNRPVAYPEIPLGNQLDGEGRKPSVTTKDEKEFLSTVWLLEQEIKEAEKEEHWVRLYCLLQTVRFLCENNWKKFTESDLPFQDFLNDNILALLYYIQEMDPETVYWPKVSQRVKDELDRGDLQVELDDLSYTFNGNPLCEEPWPQEYFAG